MFTEKNRKSMRTVSEEINTNELPFKKLADLDGKTIRVFGYFFTNGDYGKQLVVVTRNELVNMPNRYVKEFEAFTDDEIKAITNGAMMLKNIRPYVNKNGKTTYTFDYDDYDVD